MATRALLRFCSASNLGPDQGAYVVQRFNGTPDTVVPLLRRALRRFGGDAEDCPEGMATLFIVEAMRWAAAQEAELGMAHPEDVDPLVHPVCHDEVGCELTYTVLVRDVRRDGRFEAQARLRIEEDDELLFEGELADWSDEDE